MVNWLFRDRTTGRITIAQFPNVSIGLFVVLAVIRGLLMDLDATGDAARTDRAFGDFLATLVDA